MTVLVTGATGMLGSHVVRGLLDRGEQLLALSTRGDPGLLGAVRGEVRLERGGDQLDDVIWVGDAAEGVVRAALHDGPVRELYNIGSGRGTSIRDFMATVSDAYPGARIDIGPGVHYIGEEPTYGVLDATRAREDLDLAIDPDPGRGARLFERGLSELRSG